VALAPGDIATLVTAGGNHWRKILVIYAKLLQQLRPGAEPDTWQACREQHLLQAGSNTALIFTPLPAAALNGSTTHIISGKSHAEALGLKAELQWLNPHFAISTSRRIIVSPYFDYRQLPDRQIAGLAELIRPWLTPAAGESDDKPAPPSA
jgi:hypothetical protein